LLVYQELSVEASDEAVIALVLNELQVRLPPRWQREPHREPEARQACGGREVRCFVFAGEGGTPGAVVWFVLSGRTAHVADIQPTSSAPLGHHAYNDIIGRLSVALRRAVAAVPGARLVATPAHQRLEDWLDPRLADAFRHLAANLRFGDDGLAVVDPGRLQGFIVDAHQAKVQVNPALLARWLSENTAVPADLIGEVIDEYVRGRQLLQRYADQKAS